MSEPKILLVDDEPTVGDFLGEYLSGEGYEVKVLTQPLRCLEEVADASYSMLIADVRMPGMTGVELVQRVKEICPEILCILITGYGSLESMRAAMRVGVNDFLIKPCTIEELRSSVQDAFAMRHHVGGERAGLAPPIQGRQLA